MRTKKFAIHFIFLILILTTLFSSCQDGVVGYLGSFESSWKPMGTESTTTELPETDVPETEPPNTETPGTETPGTDSTDCSDHTDANADNLCDGCGISVVVVVDFYAINDLHGKLDDTDSQPGVDELTTYLQNAKKSDDHTVLLSSGDMWQGSPESNLTKGLIVTEWMNELDFVSMTLGNHEFDWGEEFIEENDRLAEFPLLAINVYDCDTNQRVDYASASVMVECGSVKIGIIGAIGDCYSSIAPERVEDVYFEVGSELTDLVKAESERLRAAGADFIVYSLHDGFGSSKSNVTIVSGGAMSSYYNIALSEGYVDLVFEAHTHQRYVMYDRYGVYHLQNGGDNKGISHAEIAINYVNDSFKVNTAEFVGTSRYIGLEDDPVVDALLEKYADDIAAMNRVVGINKSYLSSDALCDLAAKLYYEAGIERWGEEYEIALGGGFLRARSPYNLPAGEVTYGDLQSIFPFDNQLVLCSVKGEYLSSKFFYTDKSDYHIFYGEYGESIKNQIDPNATYYVVVDSYTSSYAPNHLTEVARYNNDIYARDLIAAYFEKTT